MLGGVKLDERSLLSDEVLSGSPSTMRLLAHSAAHAALSAWPTCPLPLQGDAIPFPSARATSCWRIRRTIAIAHAYVLSTPK